jgi:hypothetical protein
MPKYPESDLQRSIIKWSKLYRLPAAPDIEKNTKLFDYLFSVPNGGRYTKIQGARLKALGVKSGVHDLMVNVSRGTYHGLDIELKAGKNKLSDKQVIWANRMKLAGRKVLLIYSLEDFIKEIKLYFEE